MRTAGGRQAPGAGQGSRAGGTFEAGLRQLAGLALEHLPAEADEGRRQQLLAIADPAEARRQCESAWRALGEPMALVAHAGTSVGTGTCQRP